MVRAASTFLGSLGSHGSYQFPSSMAIMKPRCVDWNFRLYKVVGGDMAVGGELGVCDEVGRRRALLSGCETGLWRSLRARLS